MKNKALLVFAALSCAPFSMAGNNAAYPSANVAQFVVDTLDMNSLPSAFRPKKEKGKKTLTDYGFTTQNLSQRAAVLAAPGVPKSLAIDVLDQDSSGIYVCLAAPAEREASKRAQTVVLLKRKNPNSLLKGRLTFREFPACPVVGDDSAGSSY